MNLLALKDKCMHKKYYGAIKYAANTIRDEKRQEDFVCSIGRYNPYLAVLCVISNANLKNRVRIENYIVANCKYHEDVYLRRDKKNNIVLAYIFLNQYQKGYEYIARQSNIRDAKDIIRNVMQEVGSEYKIVIIWYLLKIGNSTKMIGNLLNDSKHGLAHGLVINKTTEPIYCNVLEELYVREAYSLLMRTFFAANVEKDVCKVLKVDKEEFLDRITTSSNVSVAKYIFFVLEKERLNIDDMVNVLVKKNIKLAEEVLFWWSTQNLNVLCIERLGSLLKLIFDEANKTSSTLTIKKRHLKLYRSFVNSYQLTVYLKAGNYEEFRKHFEYLCILASTNQYSYFLEETMRQVPKCMLDKVCLLESRA